MALTCFYSGSASRTGNTCVTERRECCVIVAQWYAPKTAKWRTDCFAEKASTFWNVKSGRNFATSIPQNWTNKPVGISVWLFLFINFIQTLNFTFCAAITYATTYGRFIAFRKFSVARTFEITLFRYVYYNTSFFILFSLNTCKSFKHYFDHVVC